MISESGNGNKGGTDVNLSTFRTRLSRNWVQTKHLNRGNLVVPLPTGEDPPNCSAGSVGYERSS